MRALWMCGMTPPPAIVALIRVSSSSSPLMANCKCLGVILFTFKSFEALPANSRTSAVKYSRIAALYTAEVAPTLLLALTLLFKNLWILPTGNYKFKLVLKISDEILFKLFWFASIWKGNGHLRTEAVHLDGSTYLKTSSCWSGLWSSLWFSSAKLAAFTSFSAFSCLKKGVSWVLQRRLVQRECNPWTGQYKCSANRNASQAEGWSVYLPCVLCFKIIELSHQRVLISIIEI